MKSTFLTLIAFTSLTATSAFATTLSCDVEDTSTDKIIISKAIKMTSFADHTFAALPLGWIENQGNGFVSVEDDGSVKDYSIVATSRDGKITIVMRSHKNDLYLEVEGDSKVKQVIVPDVQKESRSVLSVTCVIK